MATNPPASAAQNKSAISSAARNRPTQPYSNSTLDQATVLHLIKSEVAVVEAKMNAELSKLDANLVKAEAQRTIDYKSLSDSLTAVSSTLPSTKTMVFTVIGTGASIFLGILGVLAFAGDRFDGGMAASGALSAQATEQAATIAQINANIAALRAQAQSPAAQLGQKAPHRKGAQPLP